MSLNDFAAIMAKNKRAIQHLVAVPCARMVIGQRRNCGAPFLCLVAVSASLYFDVSDAAPESLPYSFSSYGLRCVPMIPAITVLRVSVLMHICLYDSG